MAHHIIPRGRGGNHAPDNLMWVSAQCHDFIHNHPEEATALGYLKSAPPVDMMRLWGE